MPPPRLPLATARLLLEPVAARHAPGLWAAVEESRDALEQWMSWTPAATAARTREFCLGSEEAWDDGTGYHFAVVVDGRASGVVGLTLGQEPYLGQMGYWIHSAAAGRGYTTEAAAAVVRFGFTEVELRRIELRAGEGNGASRRVAEKLGFHRDRLLPGGCSGAGGPYDCYLYALDAAECRVVRR